MRGYKVFNHDWTCRNKQYTCPGVFEEDVELEVCGRGMHFCKKAADCFGYYSFEPNNKVAEVEALGNVLEDGDKCCTDKLEIIREIPWDEVLRIVNTGKDCTGLGNIGNSNTGNWNTGDRNTGDRNTGDWNTGDWNTGDRNTGDRNTGNRNTGNWNTGNWNTGNRNTGDWNKSSFNSGCFMTEEQPIMMFNKPSGWTYRDWMNSRERRILNRIHKRVVEWIWEDDMTEDEKENNPTYESAGGYLKVLDEAECAQIWWDGLPEGERNAIKNLPNFDPEIFKACTGIRIEET